MILTYRPELENPPMAKECSLGFSFLPEEGKSRQVDSVRIESGVTRDFSEAHWEKIKDYEVVKRLLSLGALAITEEIDVEATTVSEPVADTLDNIELKAALNLIDSSFDLKQLERWNAKDQRIRVKNAIAKRIQAITEGKG